jgi:hypothetical protein
VDGLIYDVIIGNDTLRKFEAWIGLHAEVIDVEGKILKCRATKTVPAQKEAVATLQGCGQRQARATEEERASSSSIIRARPPRRGRGWPWHEGSAHWTRTATWRC